MSLEGPPISSTELAPESLGTYNPAEDTPDGKILWEVICGKCGQKGHKSSECTAELESGNI